MQSDAFSRRHPVVTFAYFAAVISLCAFLRHPVCTVISFACALSYALYLDARKTGRMLLTFCLPVFLLTAVINPAFNHRGTVTLAVLPGGNALTLESVVYGAFSALMLAALLLWFSAFSMVFTSDKLVWLAGRAFPTFALLVSMTLRFIPEFRRRLFAVRSARLALGGENGEKRGSAAVRDAFSIFSTVVTWSLENSVVTSDSMKSRGYGLPGRSAYSPYRFSALDASALCAIALLSFVTVVGSVYGAFDWHFYPSMGGALLEAKSLALDGVFLALCVVPLAIDGREAAKWRSLRSKI